MIIQIIRKGICEFMSGCIGVAGYKKTYSRLTTDILKNEPQKYETVILKIGMEEAQKGFYISRICKATNKGTGITFKAIATEKQKIDCIEYLQKLVSEINQKYGTDYQISLA